MSKEKINKYILYFIELFGSFTIFATLQVYFTGTFDAFSTLMFSLAVALFLNISIIYIRAFYRRSQNKKRLIAEGKWKK